MATHGKISCLDDAFSQFFKLEAKPVEVESLQQHVMKRRRRKGEKKLKALLRLSITCGL